MVHIEQITPLNRQGYEQLRQNTHVTTSHFSAKEMIQSYFSSGCSEYLFGINVANKPAGLLSIHTAHHTFHTPKPHTGCWLKNVMIDYYYQRQGIAKIALDEISALFSRHYDAIRLVVDTNNAVAMKTYQKLGFKVTNERHSLIQGTSQKIMVKAIRKRE